MTRPLVLLTGSYPFSALAEDTFLKEEVQSLSEAFDRVAIVPCRSEGTLAPLPPGVQVDTSLAARRRSRRTRFCAALRGLPTRPVLAEILRQRPFPLSWRLLRRFIQCVADAALVADWVAKYLRQSPADREPPILYSYWCSGSTLGGILAAQSWPALKIVTRAHGFDLYAERHQPAYLPFQKYILDRVQRIFPISCHGASYLQSRFCLDGERIRLSRLGVPDPGFVCQPSQDGIWRIVSCSHMVPVKRVPLIARSIAAAAARQPERRYAWTHFGDGPQSQLVQEVVRAEFPPNAAATLPGDVPNSHVLRHYRQQPADVFINLSESEGIPVAAMEAISVGLPLLALDVGGMSEIVTAGNGCLLPADSDHLAVGETLLRLGSDREHHRRLAQASREKWRAEFDSARNFQEFARSLVEESHDSQTRGHH